MSVFVFPSLGVLAFVHTHTPAAMAATSSVCPKCGVIAKSGESSCCGRSGAWFRSCGRAGNAKHTWYEGIQACKTLAQAEAAAASAVDRRSNAAQTNLTSSRVAIATAKAFASVPATTPKPMSVRVTRAMPAYAPIDKSALTSDNIISTSTTGDSTANSSPSVPRIFPAQAPVLVAPATATARASTSITRTSPSSNSPTLTVATTDGAMTTPAAIAHDAVKEKTITTGVCYARLFSLIPFSAPRALNTFIHTYIHTYIFHHPCIHCRPSIHPSIHLCIHLSLHSFIHPSI